MKLELELKLLVMVVGGTVPALPLEEYIPMGALPFMSIWFMFGWGSGKGALAQPP